MTKMKKRYFLMENRSGIDNYGKIFNYTEELASSLDQNNLETKLCKCIRAIAMYIKDYKEIYDDVIVNISADENDFVKEFSIHGVGKSVISETTTFYITSSCE